MIQYEGLQQIYKGKPERIKRTFFDTETGQPIDPVNPRVGIYNPYGYLVDSADGLVETTGVYYYTVNLSTADSVPEGAWFALWEGTINGELVTSDIPQFFWVKSITQNYGDGEYIINAIRRRVGDVNPNQYIVAQQDMYYYLDDAVKQIESEYPMGFTTTVTPNAITFNKTVTDVPRTLFTIQTAIDIIESIHTNGILTGMSVTLGDVKVSMQPTFQARSEALRELKKEKDNLLYWVKMNNQPNAIGVVNVDLIGAY